MKKLATLPATLLAALPATLPATAFADPGHFAESGGHSHWLALGALALAGLITAVALARAARRPARKDTRAESR